MQSLLGPPRIHFWTYTLGLEGRIRLVHLNNSNLTTNDRLDLPKILHRHPLLDAFFKVGLSHITWTQVAEEFWPDLPDIVQRALNAKFSVQSGTDVFQCFVRACNLWPSMSHESDPAATITQDILKGNPTCSPYDIKYVVEIARKWGGSSSILQPLQDFLASYQVPKIKVSTDTLKSISQLTQSPSNGDLTPLFISSIIMSLAMATSPAIKVTSGEIAHMKSDVRIELLKRLEKDLRTLFDVAASMNIAPSATNRIVNEVRIRLVYKFFGKAPEFYDGKSYYALANDAFKKLLELCATDAQVPSPFVEIDDPVVDKKKKVLGDEKDKKDKKAKSDIDGEDRHRKNLKPADTFVTYDENTMLCSSSSIKSTCERYGFDIGELVVHKKSGLALTHTHTHAHTRRSGRGFGAIGNSAT